MQPLYPAAGPSALHPFCDTEDVFPNFFPHVAWKSETKAHGHYENIEKSRPGKLAFPPIFFHVFPGCTASGWRCFTPPSPWAGASGASNSQSFNRSFAKICVRDAPFHRETVCVKLIANSGFGSRGDAPCGGGGGKAPPWSPHAPPGNRMKNTDCYFRRMGAGTFVPAGSRVLPWCRGEAPHGSYAQ